MLRGAEDVVVDDVGSLEVRPLEWLATLPGSGFAFAEAHLGAELPCISRRPAVRRVDGRSLWQEFPERGGGIVLAIQDQIGHVEVHSDFRALAVGEGGEQFFGALLAGFQGDGDAFGGGYARVDGVVRLVREDAEPRQKAAFPLVGLG